MRIKPNKGQRLLTNIGSMMIGNFSSKVLSFLLVPIYTSVLTTEEYGTYDLIITTITLLLPIFTLSVYEAMLRMPLDNIAASTKVLKNGMYVILIGFIAFLVISPAFLFVKVLAGYYAYIVLYYISFALYQCISYYVRGIGEIKAYTIAGFTNTAVMLVMNILVLKLMDVGFRGYLWAGIIANISSAIVGGLKGKVIKYFSIECKIDKQVLKQMLVYSCPLIPNAVSWWVNNSADRYMLTYISGVGICGLYSVAYKIPSILSSVTTIVNTAWQISSVEGFGSEESKLFFEKVYSVYSSILCIAASIIIFFTRIIARILYQAEFYEAWRIVPILTMAMIFSSLGGFFGTIYTAAKKTRAIMFTTISGAIVNVIANACLIPGFGGYGAALATLLGYLGVYLVRMIDSKKILDFKVRYFSDFSTYMILIIESICIMYNTRISTFISIICLGVVLVLKRSFIYDLLQRLTRPNR